MSGRRGDAFYFGILAVVVGVALWAGSRDDDEPMTSAAIDFSLPGLHFELPLELPVPHVRFKRPETPELDLGHDTEGVIVEVRRGLLASSSREGDDVEIAIETEHGAPASPQLAAAFD